MSKIKKPSKKIVVLLLVIILALAMAAYFLQKANQNNDTKSTPKPESFINYNPPTEQEQKSGDNKKPEIVNQEESRNTQQPTTNSGKRAVKPIVTYATQYNSEIEIGGYVNGIFEDGGTCTVTVTKDDKQQTKSVSSVKNVNSVDCPVMALATSSLSPGTWTAVITYTSATAEGKSESKTFEVK